MLEKVHLIVDLNASKRKEDSNQVVLEQKKFVRGERMDLGERKEWRKVANNQELGHTVSRSTKDA